MKRIFLSLFVLGTAGAFAAAGLGDSTAPSTPLSPSIFPQPRRAPTQAHVKCPETKKSCITCHPKARTSKWASDRLIPKMADCGKCHPVTRDANLLSPLTEDCRACHRTLGKDNMPIRSDYRRPNLRFSHAAHKNTPCAACHPHAAGGAPPSAALDVIGMKGCFACHSSSSCRTCHITDKDGRMVTDFGKGKLKPPAWLQGKSHGTQWRGTHAAQAGRDSKFCASCHQESFCRDCHAGARRPRNVHPGDWLTSHGVSTRLDNPRCKSCHRAQSFCITCHRRAGVAPDSPENAKPEAMGRYHKNMDTRTLMRRAEHDILSCAACHSESSCITCHIRYNPHPPNFSRRCKALVARNRNACTKCHTGNVSDRCK
jgi:hypothetical protein